MFYVTSVLVDRDYMFLIIYQRVMFHCNYHQPFDTALARLLRANGRDFCHVQSKKIKEGTTSLIDELKTWGESASENAKVLTEAWQNEQQQSLKEFRKHFKK